MRIRKEIKLGILFTLSLFLVIWGINYLKGKDIFSRQIVFYTVFDEVTGLLVSNPVTVSGVNIGQVNRVNFMPDGSGRVLITAVIDRQIRIPSNSQANIEATDIFGYKELKIQLGDAGSFISSGDTLEGVYKPSFAEALAKQMEPIQNQATAFAAKLDSIITAVNSILNEENRLLVQQSIHSLQAGMASIESAALTFDTTLELESKRLSNIFGMAESIITNIDKNNESLDRIIQNFAEISDTLASEQLAATILDASEAIHSLNSILSRVEQGEGSAGLLLQDDSLYINLRKSSLQLEKLLEDIRNNPGKYFNISVFGRR